MSARRISAIFRRDLMSGTREFLLIYMTVAPVLLAVLFRLFIPSVNAISFKFAVDEALGEEVIRAFDKYGSVEVLKGRAAVEERVLKIDDTAGITADADGDFMVFLEGNEVDTLEYAAREIIYELTHPTENKLDFRFSNIGKGLSPLFVYGSVGMVIMAITMGGMIIGLNIVEEKEAGTISALLVSPLEKWEFIFGKSLIGLVFPIVYVFILLWIFGITWVNPWKVILFTVISSLFALILGFLIGVLSSNQLAAVANMKGLSVIVSGSFLGAVLLPANKHFFLYWSPVYWSIMGFYKLITNQASWYLVGQYSLWILGLTTAVFLLAHSRIRMGIS